MDELLKEKETLGFIIHSESYYAADLQRVMGDNFVDEVTFGYYWPDGSTSSGEMSITWDQAGPELRISYDAWALLKSFETLQSRLALLDGNKITPIEFSRLLLELGFSDLTKRTRA